ncbi:MAG: hypothetical protein AB8G14_16475 [Ilumatobacter sp.]
MDNDKAIAASAAMVAVAAIASGALFFSAQTGASNIEPVQPAPQPAVIIEYVDTAGNLIPIELDDTTSRSTAADMTTPAPVSKDQDDEYEEYDDEEYEDD